MSFKLKFIFKFPGPIYTSALLHTVLGMTAVTTTKAGLTVMPIFTSVLHLNVLHNAQLVIIGASQAYI